MPQPNPMNWEHVEGSGIPLRIADLITRLQAIEQSEGNLPCQIRNYLEENCLAPITDIQLDRGAVVLESFDLPATEEERN